MSPSQMRTDGELSLTYVVAGIGFGCLIGWELSGVFSTSLVLLGYYSITTAVTLRIISLITQILVFILCVVRSDWVLENKNTLFLTTAFLSLPAVANAFIGVFFAPLPLVIAALFWALFGIAQGSVATYWCIFYSLIPTARTAVSIGLGAVFGTALFVFVNAPGSTGVSLSALALVIACSIVIPYFLSKRMPADWALPASEYHKVQTLTFPATLSMGCFGAAYGFMSITVCTLGPLAALIGGASGIVGTVLACVWGYLGTKVEIDGGLVQRGSLPILLGGLLLFPLFGYWGQVICCGIVITALAHHTLTNLYGTCIDNYEFRLHPVERYGLANVPTYVGFLLGSLLSFFIMVLFPLPRESLMFALVLFSLIIVVSFVIYGADESETRQRLNKLLDTAVTIVTELPQKTSSGEAANADAFSVRCEEIVLEYKLTPREAEVFHLLAKGRNAEYIARNLVVSTATVKSHIYHIYRKLDVRSQQHLMDIVDDETVEQA